MKEDKTMDNNIIEILNKIIGILGYDTYDSFIKVYFDARKKRIEYKVDNEIAIKRVIMDNDRLTLGQKVELNAALGNNLKNFQRQIEVLGIAVDNMDDDAKAENLNNDWLLDFFDKASLIMEKETKLIWGKLLSYASSDKHICSKTLLNTLFLMGTEDISSFLNICRFTLSEMHINKEDEHIWAYPIIFFSDYVEKYNVYMLSSFKLNKLQRLGLIEVDYKSEYVFAKKSMELIYGNQLVKVENKKKIKIGNVRFTYDGFLLYQITEKLYNNSLLNEIIEIWRNRGYAIYINGRIVTPKGN